jgi:hypothetical protein
VIKIGFGQRLSASELRVTPIIILVICVITPDVVACRRITHLRQSWINTCKNLKF